MSGASHTDLLLDQESQRGDLIEKTTYAMGIKPCGSSEKLAQAQWGGHGQ